tara:strand:+ start:381404 stop:383440 length:2037 start_codon:yes stop_codon:yes gene_type:complete
MAEVAEITKEILGSVNEDVRSSVAQELKQMTETEGLDGKPIINKFYSIWKASDGKKGHDNKINSWTAFHLGMTDKEPDGDFLPRRRCFARKGFPDIDSDFDDEHRDEIYDYIIEKYGRENVGNIGTYQSIKLKSYIRQVFRALDPDKVFNPKVALSEDKAAKRENNERWRKETNEKGDEISKSLPKQIGATIRTTDEEGNEVIIWTVEDGVKHCDDFARYIQKYPDLLAYSSDIQGLLSNFSVHAAGIVISSVPLDSIAPLRRSKKKKSELSEDDDNPYELATQFANEDLEFMGLIKFDILAIATLSVVQRTINLVKENYGIDIDVENLALDDNKTFSLYRKGDLNGVFQCEKHGMQHTMKEIGVDRFEDIIAGVALYRPGPMKSIPSYAARKAGDEQVEFFHPKIEPHVRDILGKTYGILVYQEQVMQICNSLAGFSITDGYGMIKAVGKKIPSLMAKYEKQFIEGGVQNGVPENVIKQYWDQFITPFASYGFNKSHAACYGYLSYTTAYLKAHYPEEYMSSYLNVMLRSNKQDKYEKISQFEKECERMDMEILPRSINKCKWDYEIITKRDPSKGVQKSEIRPSIRCKGLSQRAAMNIIENQPFKDLRDFAFATDPKKVDSKSVECLALAGFFKEKKGNRVVRRKAEEVVEEFSVLREDRKRVGRKGVESDDLFGG